MPQLDQRSRQRPLKAGARFSRNALSPREVVRGLALADASRFFLECRASAWARLLIARFMLAMEKRREARELGRGLVDLGLELGAIDQPVEVADAQTGPRR